MKFLNRTSLKFIFQFILIVMTSFLIISVVSLYTDTEGGNIKKENLLPQTERE
jgi:hypothetical protein